MVSKSLIILLIAILVAGFLASRRSLSLSEEQLRSNLAGKVILVCGASSGIGEQLTYDLARIGAKIVITARRLDRLEAVKAKAIEMQPGAEIAILRRDFSDVNQAESVFSEAMKFFGHIDHLMIYHADIKLAPILSVPHGRDPTAVARIFQVNMLSYIQITLAALPHIQERSGHITVTSSVAGELPVVIAPLYAATKHAMNGFFYSVNQELAILGSNTSITVAALGMIETDAVTRDFKLDESSTYRLPSFAVGSVTECSKRMIESLVTRPHTLTFPFWSGMIGRLIWQFAPSLTQDEKFYEFGLKLNQQNRL